MKDLGEWLAHCERLHPKTIDMIVDRRELRSTIARQIAMLQRLPSDAVA